MGVVVNGFNLSTGEGGQRWVEEWVQTGEYLCFLASLVYIANSRLVQPNEILERVDAEKWEQGSKERKEDGKKTLQIRARAKAWL
jgi:hypothetical protein